MVIEGCFTFEHNLPASIEREYEQASRFYRQVCALCDFTDAGHVNWFMQAKDRLDIARELLLAAP